MNLIQSILSLVDLCVPAFMCMLGVGPWYAYTVLVFSGLFH